jgi:hypothetical protein
MDLVTTQRHVHNGQKGKPAEAINKDEALGERPMMLSSSYQNSFPNWKNGNKDCFHEKKPQYPIYSMPFKANSSYRQSFSDDKNKKLKAQTIRVQGGRQTMK